MSSVYIVMVSGATFGAAGFSLASVSVSILSSGAWSDGSGDFTMTTNFLCS